MTDTVPAAVDPTLPGPTFTVRRLAPFAIVFVLSALSPAIPHSITPIATWWSLAGVQLVVVAAACALAMRLPNGHWWHTFAPLLAFPLIQLLRAADGYAASGFSPLLFLPVMWFALYGPLRDVVIGIVAAANVLLWPIIFIGGTRYPTSGLRGSILLITVLGVTGLVINALVRSSRSAAEKIVQSERRFRAAFEDAPVGMAMTGISGDRAGYFLRVNSALCALFGRTAEELTSRPVSDFTHPDDLTQTALWFYTAADEQKAHRVEKRYLHKSGRTIWASVSFSVLRDGAGRPLHLISQIEDVSARRNADKALLDALDRERDAAAQMRQVDQTRTAVLSNAAHDLRTPLTSAAGFTELLLDGSAGDLTDSQRALVETVERSLTRLGSIVTELVTTAKKQNDPVPAARDPFDLGAVLDGAIQAMSIMSSQAGQRLTSDNQLSDVPIEGDPDRIDRALSNLIGNAVKFTPSGGDVHVAGERRDGHAVISIRDNGIGIADGDHDHIFERYYRSERDSSHSVKGTGLGLAIVKEIVAQHRGTIAVTSAPGKGSTFVLTLPIAAPDVAQLPR